jgi:hypothetical protein
MKYIDPKLKHSALHLYLQFQITNLIKWYNVVTSWITGIGAIDFLGDIPFKVPITD